MSSRVADELSLRPTSFEVGAHKVVVAKLSANGRWSVTVDGARADGTFESEVDAWAEGVRRADLIDRGGAAALAR